MEVLMVLASIMHRVCLNMMNNLKKSVIIQFVLYMIFESCGSNDVSRIKSNTPITREDVQHWIAAWNSHNIDSIDAFYAEGALVYQPQNANPLTKKTMNPFFEMVFKTYPDIKFESKAITVDGYEAVSWEMVTGTMEGTFTNPVTGQVIQPNGKHFEYEVAKRIEYNQDHKIKEVHIIFDQLTLSKQLDLPIH